LLLRILCAYLEKYTTFLIKFVDVARFLLFFSPTP